MITKTIEILDRMTCLPVLAIQLEPESERDRKLFAHLGFGLAMESQREYIVLVKLNDMQATWDPYTWGDRTMMTAHQHIAANFDTIESGSIVDVEAVLGETAQPRESQVGR